MDHASVEYITTFQAKLGDAVSQALDLGNPMIGGLKAMGLYSIELQISAAYAGESLGIPHELAAAYFISAEAMRYESGINKLSLAFSSGKRKLYETHRKLMMFALPIMQAAPDKALAQRFLPLMMEDLQRVHSKVRA
jgi:hypothetical protein